MPIKWLSSQLFVKMVWNQHTQWWALLVGSILFRITPGRGPSLPCPHAKSHERKKPPRVSSAEMNLTATQVFISLELYLKGSLPLSSYHLEIKSFRVIITKGFGFSCSLIPQCRHVLQYNDNADFPERLSLRICSEIFLKRAVLNIEICSLHK